MKFPKISIIMSTFNESLSWIQESINSILKQTFIDFEFIIINDNPMRKDLEEFLQKYSKKDKRIKIILNNKNLGLPKSLNEGINIAKGKYIARMDADDVAIKNRLEIQYKFLQKRKDIFLTGSSAIVIGEKGERIGFLYKYNNYKKIKNKLKNANPMIHSSIIFRNKGYKYNKNFLASQDYELYKRLLKDGEKITNLENPLIKYRLHNKSISKQKNYLQKKFFLKAKGNYNENELKEEDKFVKEKNKLKFLIFIQLSDNQSKNVRKNIKLFYKKYGLDKQIIIYYLLNFIPISFLRFLQKNLF